MSKKKKAQEQEAPAAAAADVVAAEPSARDADDASSSPAPPMGGDGGARGEEPPQAVRGGALAQLKDDVRSFVSDVVALPVWQKAVAIAMISYCLVVTRQRFAQCMNPWVAETDWKQWVWQYWRYHIDGAFPEGHVITDYTFNAQPPLYHLAMMILSSFAKPVVAANIVNFIGWGFALIACVVGLRKRTHLLVGLACAMLFVHDDILHRITMGGYPRSWGPPLTLLFLAAWLNGRHKLVLLVLLCSAAIYPSVCVPAGLAYGLWTLATAPRTSLKAWLVPNLQVIATGVGVGVLGLWQSLTAPKWWGSVVWAEEAGVALTASGRTAWLPLDKFWPSVLNYAKEPWHQVGELWVGAKAEWGHVPWTNGDAIQAGWVSMLVVAVVGVAFNWKNGKRKVNELLPVPAQMLLMLACAVFSFWLAQKLAFKLYLPRRMVQHTLPSIMFVTLCLLYFHTGMAIFKQQRNKAAAFVLAVLVVPFFTLSGDGLGQSTYRSYKGGEKLYNWILKNTKVTDQFGGYYRVLDEVPFFAARQVYVNWKMAHPFRKGFYEEIDRRTVEMYDAFFCTDLKDLLAFMDKNDVAYFIVADTLFEKLEGGDSQLFEPTRGKILKNIFRPRHGRFALKNPPAEIVVFKNGAQRVLSREKLRAYLAKNPSTTTTEPQKEQKTDPSPADDAAPSEGPEN